MLILGIILEGGQVGVAYLLGWVFGQSATADLHWSSRDFLIGILASIPMLLGFEFLLSGKWGPLREIRHILEDWVKPALGSAGRPGLLCLAAAAGIGEEMVFRAVVQGALTRKLGVWASIGIASLIFGACHPISLLYAFVVTLIGGYLGWLWVYTGNLLVPIVTHGFYDWIALLLLLRRPLRPSQ